MAKRTWTNKQLNDLRENYLSSSTEELCLMFPGKTKNAIRAKAIVLGLRKNNRFYFSEEDDSYLRENYANTLNADLAKHLKCKKSSVDRRAQRLGLKKDKAFIAEISRKLSENPNHPMNKYKFTKGTVPPNKGKKQTEYMSPEAIERTKATRFKKGDIPHNHKPVGYERSTRDGYRERKVAEPNVFKLVHRLVWEEKYGEIPEGYNVQFKDGNRTNCVIDNLYIISREDQMRQNTIHNYPDNLKKAIRLKSKLNKIINKKQKNEKAN